MHMQGSLSYIWQVHYNSCQRPPHTKRAIWLQGAIEVKGHKLGSFQGQQCQVNNICFM